MRGNDADLDLFSKPVVRVNLQFEIECQCFRTNLESTEKPSGVFSNSILSDSWRFFLIVVYIRRASYKFLTRGGSELRIANFVYFYSITISILIFKSITRHYFKIVEKKQLFKVLLCS